MAKIAFKYIVGYLVLKLLTRVLMCYLLYFFTGRPRREWCDWTRGRTGQLFVLHCIWHIRATMYTVIVHTCYITSSYTLQMQYFILVILRVPIHYKCNSSYLLYYEFLYITNAIFHACYITSSYTLHYNCKISYLLYNEFLYITNAIFHACYITSSYTLQMQY